VPPQSDLVREPIFPEKAVFGVPSTMAPEDARSLLNGLRLLFEAQIDGLASLGRTKTVRARTSPVENRTLRVRPLDREGLIDDLTLMRAWFDPTAKGERVREAVACVNVVRVELPFKDTLLVRDVGSGRRLVTPEGRVLISCLEAALDEYEATKAVGPIRDEDSWLSFRNEDVAECTLLLLTTYRSWSRRRLDDVVGLLTSETSTLRPAAAGLLLTLLINRNTDPSRALPRPSDPRMLEIISEAIARPATTYATALTDSNRTSARSLDLYRGWPLGELRRRLGPSLHSGFDSGIYIEPTAVEDAISRLVTDIERRPERLQARVPAALEATLATYEQLRPQLAGLGLAFENPAQTRRLIDTLQRAALRHDANSLDGARTLSDTLFGPDDD
jgi:hypothetical protein